jgi:sulfur carrier protein ThiS
LLEPAQSEMTGVRPREIRITLKLFAMLSGYLPDGAARNQVDIAVPVGATPASVMAALNLPQKLCALVMVNGVFVRVSDRSSTTLSEGDVLAIWPPIAGG